MRKKNAHTVVSHAGEEMRANCLGHRKNAWFDKNVNISEGSVTKAKENVRGRCTSFQREAVMK